MNLTKTIRKLPITEDGQRAGYYVHDDLSNLNIKYDEPQVRKFPLTYIFTEHARAINSHLHGATIICSAALLQCLMGYNAAVMWSDSMLNSERLL